MVCEVCFCVILIIFLIITGTKSPNSINATCNVAYKAMREIRNAIETLIDTVKVSWYLFLPSADLRLLNKLNRLTKRTSQYY